MNRDANLTETLTETLTNYVPERFRIRDEAGVRALSEEIRGLAREKNAVILAHSYQLPEVQEVADYVGDSLGLAREAQKSGRDRIIFCGVHFMAESAKILNPGKKVFIPNLSAGCALSDSITPESLQDWKEKYPDHTVVTYVNSTAEVKAMSDICCTSANAVSVCRSLESDKILFTPDRHLGSWVAKQVPEKEFAIYDGLCPTHDVLRNASVKMAMRGAPEAIIIAHPECREDVIAVAHEVCSTTGMIAAVKRHPDAKTFIVATEWAMLHRLKTLFPEKDFIVADGCIGCRLHCPYMKMIDLEAVKRSLVEEVFEVEVPADVAKGARRALERMMAVPRDK